MTTMATGRHPHRTARQRLLDAADELFYDKGVHTVGIDRIIEHAGVAKASLYNTFGSKEELVEAYLGSRHARTTARLTDAVGQHTDPVARVYAVFDAQAEILAQPDFRGCAFVSASAEAPPGGVIERAADSYDGAILSARMDRDPSVAVTARAAVTALLDAALAAHDAPSISPPSPPPTTPPAARC